jgi:hypothetical protein
VNMLETRGQSWKTAGSTFLQAPLQPRKESRVYVSETFHPLILDQHEPTYAAARKTEQADTQLLAPCGAAPDLLRPSWRTRLLTGRGCAWFRHSQSPSPQSRTYALRPYPEKPQAAQARLFNARIGRAYRFNICSRAWPSRRWSVSPSPPFRIQLIARARWKS